MYGVNSKTNEISLDMNMIEKSLVDIGPNQEVGMSESEEGCTTECVNLVEGDRDDHGRITKARRRVVKEVQTEFVYRGDEDYSRVHVCGDWSNWRPIGMHLEEESNKGNLRRRTNNPSRIWSVITPVTIGYHEFCFMTDCHMTVSRRHPTTRDGKRNWRTVRGPRGEYADTERLAEVSVRGKWSESKLFRTLDRLADGLYVMAFGRRMNGDEKELRADDSKARDREREREKERENNIDGLHCQSKAPNLTMFLIRGAMVCGSVCLALVGMVWLRGALMSIIST